MYKEIVERLTAAYWSHPDAAPTVEVVDATLNAVARSGSEDFSAYQDLVRASTVHRLARESYHRKLWSQALDYARRAQQMEPERTDAAEIEFKALVQLEQWGEAESKLDKIRLSGSRRAWYLEGFLYRKMRKFRQAITSFQAALDSGDRGYAVQRDLADCLYREHEYDKALAAIKTVLERDAENIFVLDLVIRIAVDSKKLDIAQENLERLDRFDLDRRFINHRRASYYSAKGLNDLALIEAEKACSTGHAPFEAYAQRIDIEIDQKRFADAEQHLFELEGRFRTSRTDIQKGLRCKLLIRQRKWREAETVWNLLEDKSTAMVNVMLRNIYQLKAEDGTLGLSEREDARRSVEELVHVVEEIKIQHGHEDTDEWLDM